MDPVDAILDRLEAALNVAAIALDELKRELLQTPNPES